MSASVREIRGRHLRIHRLNNRLRLRLMAANLTGSLTGTVPDSEFLGLSVRSTSKGKWFVTSEQSGHSTYPKFSDTDKYSYCHSHDNYEANTHIRSY